jgi:hypothetical protein
LLLNTANRPTTIESSKHTSGFGSWGNYDTENNTLIRKGTLLSQRGVPPFYK